MLTQQESLTEAESVIAHNLAMTLVKESTDVNELGKAIAYLRSIVNQPQAGTRFFKYLKTLVTNGRQIGHSGKTTDYYRSIERACSKYIQEQANPHTILKVLGWAMRLMRYYKVTPIEEFPTFDSPTQPESSPRQAEIAEVLQLQKFKVDQILDATVLSVKGNKVTYEMLGTVKLTEKEPKKATSLKEGQVVKVKIAAIKEDGNIKNVKCI
jgi:nucleoid DNA-binding protein